MYFNTQYNIFCNILSIGDTYVIIETGGYEYVSSMEFMLLL